MLSRVMKILFMFAIQIGLVSCDGIVVKEACGNGQIDQGEDCDGNTGGQTCVSINQGYTDGTLACHPTTCEWDTTNCTGGPVCGDGDIEAPEVCDGNNLNGQDCTTIGQGFDDGALACHPTTCEWDTTNCTGGPVCGDGDIEAPEVCDGNNLNGQDCTTIGQGFNDGTLACHPATCEWDTTNCTGGPVCGDGDIEAPEVCDGNNLNGQDCTTIGQGFDDGTLACHPTTCEWDTTNCTGGPVCGDGDIEAPEICDGNNLNGQDCTTIGQGFDDGALACHPTTCEWDTSNCTVVTSAFYVTENGSDINNDYCSQAEPCRTIQRAADLASQPGSVVFVSDGEYDGFHSVHDGIKFLASGNNVVVNEGNDIINVENNNDIVIDGFIVRDAGRTGIRVVNADNVIIRNNTVGPSGKWGILTGFAEEVQIIDNQTFDSDDEHGIYVANSDSSNDNPVIRGNEVWGNGHNGIQINGDCHMGGDGVITGAIVENNLVYDNNWKGLSIISAPGVMIRNNVIYDNGISAGAGGIHLVNEPGCDASQSTSGGAVVNNTIVEPRIAGIRMTDSATDNVIFNNIIISDTQIADEVGGNHISSSNLTQSSSSGVFDDNYRPAVDGPAADAGEMEYHGISAPDVDIEGTARPQGSGIDLGAYELEIVIHPPDRDFQSYTKSWHPDEDGDFVLRDVDNCPATYNPLQENADGDDLGDACDLDFVDRGSENRINDLRALLVTPYGGWFTFTSFLGTTYGYHVSLVWSQTQSDLETAAGIQGLKDAGQAISRRIGNFPGDEIFKPFIVIDMDPGRRYYVAVVQYDYTGVLFAQRSDILTIDTHGEPFPTPTAKHPHLMATAQTIAATQVRFNENDSEVVDLVNAYRLRIASAVSNPGGYNAYQYCETAAFLHQVTGEAALLTDALILLDHSIDYWNDNQLTGNQYRWSDHSLAKCADLLWPTLSVAKKDEVADAVLSATDANRTHFLETRRYEDTDELANIPKGMLVEGLLLCGDPDLTGDRAARGCAAFELGKRIFFGIQMPRSRRVNGFFAQAGGVCPDGTFYGIASGRYWLETFMVLDNSGFDASQLAPFVRNRLYGMFLYPTVPSGRGRTPFGDIENFVSTGNDLDTSPNGGTVHVSLIREMLWRAGYAEDAAFAARYFADIFPNPDTGSGGRTRLYTLAASVAPQDYRSVLDTGYLAGGIGIILDRTTWQSDASQLMFKGGFINYDHSHGDQGNFQLYRRGAMLIPESTAYGGTASDGVGHNVLVMAQLDGSWGQGKYGGMGQPSLIRVGRSASHTMAVVDTTGYYWGGGLGDEKVSYARVQRSLVYIKDPDGTGADRIVTYDYARQASHVTAPLDKFWNMQFSAAPTITGRSAVATVSTEPTESQKVFVEVVLPSSASLSVVAPTGTRNVYGTDPYFHQLRVDPGAVTELRMVTVVSASDSADNVVHDIEAIESATLIGTRVDNDVLLFPVEERPLRIGDESAVTRSFTTNATGPLRVVVAGCPAEGTFTVIASAGGGTTVELTPSPSGPESADAGGFLTVLVNQ